MKYFGHFEGILQRSNVVKNPTPVLAVVNTAFNITPEQIRTDRHFFNAFDHCETEISAGWLVKFAQDRGRGWEPFTYEEINEFYESNSKFKRFTFNRLVEPGTTFSIRTGYEHKGGGWIVLDADKLHHFTGDFVERCYKSSPAIESPGSS